MDTIKKTSNAVQNIKERHGYWTSKGLTGGKAWKALSTDDQIPLFIDAQDAADLEGVTVHCIKARRVRRQGPPWLAVSSKSVRYATADYFAWLADRFEGTA